MVSTGIIRLVSTRCVWSSRGLADDHEVAAQVPGQPADRRDQGGRREHGQETLAEVPPQLVLAGSRPPRLVGAGETGHHPAQLLEGAAFRPVADELLEGGPAGLAVLPGHDRLRLVQAAELPRGQAAFGLELEVAQVGPAGQRT
jgi:hypothetical protein